MTLIQSSAASGSPASSPILYQILFLVPGYFTYLLAVKVGRVRSVPNYGRFDKLMFSLTASGTSIAVLHIFYTFATDQGPMILPSQLPFNTLAFGYITHLVLTGVAGALIGCIIRRCRDETLTGKHTWIDLHQDTDETSPRIRVITSNGHIISGDLYRYERSDNSQDLRLQNAEVKNDPYETADLPDKQEVYLYGDKIEYIWFVSDV